MPLLSVRRQTTTAPSITVADVTLTPEARAWIVRLPRGGLVWSRPVAVRVERGGQERRLAVRDPTRRLLAVLGGLILASAAVVLVASFALRRRKNP